MISRKFSFLLIAVSLSLVSCVSTGLTQQNTAADRKMLEESSPEKSLPTSELANFADSVRWAPAPSVDDVARRWVAQIEAYLPGGRDVQPQTAPVRPAGQPVRQQLSLRRQQTVIFAMRYRGVAYRYGGSTPKGFDCSGFTQFVMSESGIKLPRTAREQARIGKRIRPLDGAAGDLLFFGTRGRITHVGLIINNPGQPLSMVHASSRGVVTTIIAESEYWRKRLLFARRVLN